MIRKFYDGHIQSDCGNYPPSTDTGVEEKAKALVEKFLSKMASQCEHEAYCDKAECVFEKLVWCKIEIDKAKQCAIICCDEIILTCPQKENEIFAISKGVKFWQDVKTAITNL